MDQYPRLVFTTDVNGTITGENTFAELVRPDGFAQPMIRLMNEYTSGLCGFSSVLGKMQDLTKNVNREKIRSYACRLSLFPGVRQTVFDLVRSPGLETRVGLSTTGFSGTIVMINRLHFDLALDVAASPVLTEHLTDMEKTCIVRFIRSEEDKVAVTNHYAKSFVPSKSLIFHVGDTLGDFPALKNVAEMGGLGIAFCPNQALDEALQELVRETRRHVAVLKFENNDTPDYRKVGDLVRQAVWTAVRTEL